MSANSGVPDELAFQVRLLLGSVPRPGSPTVQVAAYLMRKAEVLDWLSVLAPSVALQAKELATRARYQARALTGEPGTI